MMVLDYLNNSITTATKRGGEQDLGNYDVALSKLSEEVKSWSFMYSKGKAKYTYEDCNSAIFFLCYSWDLLHKYGSDLDFSSVCFIQLSSVDFCLLRINGAKKNKQPKTTDQNNLRSFHPVLV